jgi:hypothetical protein
MRSYTTALIEPVTELPKLPIDQMRANYLDLIYPGPTRESGPFLTRLLLFGPYEWCLRALLFNTTVLARGANRLFFKESIKYVV